VYFHIVILYLYVDDILIFDSDMQIINDIIFVTKL